MHPSAQDHEKGGGVPPGGGSPGQPQPGPGRRRGGSGRMGQPQEPRSPGDSEVGGLHVLQINNKKKTLKRTHKRLYIYTQKLV